MAEPMYILESFTAALNGNMPLSYREGKIRQAQPGTYFTVALAI